ncbi:MAG TPA: hypothetical protein VGI72_09150, partial [Gaiellales bacterium]
MRLVWLSRGLAVSGLSATSAVAAHEGPGALAAGRPLLAALAGAVVAVLGVGALLAAAASRHARAVRIRRGDLLATRLDPHGRPGAAVLVATLLVCQAAAHATLILCGVAAHGGPPAPLALHALLALIAAAAMIACERLLGAATAMLAAAIAAVAGTLAARPAVPARGVARRPHTALPD